MNYKKIVFTSPWIVETVSAEINQEEIPSGHVLLKKHYSLISAGTELACLSGGEWWFEMPATPGYCCVGEIEALGDGVEDFKPGDRIFCYGSHSEYEVIPCSGIFLKIPDDMDIKTVPFVRIATIAMTALRTSNIEVGDYVAVTGQGLVGNMAAQLAAQQGATVIAIDLSDRRLALSQSCGIKYTINPSKQNVIEEILNISGGKKVSTLIDATGVSKVAVDSLELIAKGGEMIFLGSPRGEYSTDVTKVLNYSHLADFDITFKGAHEWKYPVVHNEFVKHSLERNSKIVFRLIEEGRIKTQPMLSDIIKPEMAYKAYENLRKNKEDYIGVLIDWL